MYNAERYPKTNKVRRAIAITAASAFLMAGNPFLEPLAYAKSARDRPATNNLMYVSSARDEYELSDPTKGARIMPGAKKYTDAKKVSEDLKRLISSNEYRKALVVCDNGLILGSGSSEKIDGVSPRIYYFTKKADINEKIWEKNHDEQSLKDAISACTFGISEAVEKTEIVLCFKLREASYKKLEEYKLETYKNQKNKKDFEGSLKDAYAKEDNYACIVLSTKMRDENIIDESGVLDKIIASRINRADPDYVLILALIERAKSYMRQDVLANAIFDLRKATERDRNNTDVHYLLGFALHLTGRKEDEAKKEWKISNGLRGKNLPYYDTKTLK